MAEEMNQRRLQIEAHREIRRRLEQFGNRVGATDGANKEGLREWIRGIDNAVAWTGAPDMLVLEMVGYLTTGSLATLVRDHISPAAGAGHTWRECRALIIQNFLNEDEQEYLRSRVEALVQNAYEDTREYGRRFRDGVNKAYTLAEMAVPLVMERLVNLFINGVRDKQVRTQVHLAKPGTLDLAINCANNASRAVGKAECNTRVEEPMEVGALAPPHVPVPRKDQTSKEDDVKQLVKTLQGEVKSLRKSLERQVQAQAQGPPTAPVPAQGGRGQSGQRGRGMRRQPVRNAQGEPRCFNCNRYGHMARECRQEEAIVAAVEAAVAARMDAQGN